MVHETPSPDDPMIRLGREIFPIHYDAENNHVFVDPNRFPKFNTSLFGKEQVATILGFITPYYWRAIRFETDIYSEKDGEVVEDSLEVLNLGLEFHKLFFRLLDRYAPIDDAENEHGFIVSTKWEKWMHDVIAPQVSPVITEDDPELARQQIENIKKHRLRVFLDELQQRIEGEINPEE